MPLEETLGEAPPPTRRVATAAPLSRRFAAWLIDCGLAVTPIAFALAVVAVGGPATPLSVVAFVGASAIAITNDISLVVRTGQSIGRRIVGIRVVDSQRMTPPTVMSVILRNLFGGLSLGFGISWHPLAVFPSFFILLSPWPLICYGFAVADRRWHRALNDHCSHTVVIDVRAEALA